MRTNTPAVDGRRRPTLADQLDRLDTILDGLGEALAEAVAGAVKEAVGAAMAEVARRTQPCPVQIRPPAAAWSIWWGRVRVACGWAAARVRTALAGAAPVVRGMWTRATAEPHRRWVANAAVVAGRAIARATARGVAAVAAGLRAARGRPCRRPAAVGGGWWSGSPASWPVPSPSARPAGRLIAGDVPRAAALGPASPAQGDGRGTATAVGPALRPA